MRNRSAPDKGKSQLLKSKDPIIITQAVKSALCSVAPDRDIFRYFAYRPMFETWKRRVCESGGMKEFADRLELYSYISREMVREQPITYAEFGVFKGQSIKAWSKLHSNSNSKFFGFDTFTGLPETWVDGTRIVGQGKFDTHGSVPETDDSRIEFVRGLFQETLPGFLKSFRRNGKLVVHNDSDLYSATLYVLAKLDDYLLPGDIVIFDEFYSVMHEFRAFSDYTQAFMRTLQPVAATKGFVQVAFEVGS